MAQFQWVQYPANGWCLSCMASTNDRGFVDMIGEALAKREDGSEEVVGVYDVHYCGHCIEQAAKLVGCASAKEVEELVFSSVEKDEEIEKLKDEVQAWQQRFDLLMSETFTEQVRKAMESNKEKSDDPVADPA